MVGGSNPSRPQKRELYVEGGGDRNPSLASECRRAFSKLFEKAGVQHKPRVIVCGGRKNAYDQFLHAHEAGGVEAWLLVDSEEPVTSSDSPWDHVKTRKGDGWDRPLGATDEQLHFMHVCMETWLIADPDALAKIFGSKFEKSKLPAIATLEKSNKQKLYESLSAASKATPAGRYGKGDHSFRVLGEVAPQKLRQLAWAKRFLDAMGAVQ
jgi:hypothetical protein